MRGVAYKCTFHIFTLLAKICHFPGPFSCSFLIIFTENIKVCHIGATELPKEKLSMDFDSSFLFNDFKILGPKNIAIVHSPLKWGKLQI